MAKRVTRDAFCQSSLSGGLLDGLLHQRFVHMVPSLLACLRIHPPVLLGETRTAKPTGGLRWGTCGPVRKAVPPGRSRRQRLARGFPGRAADAPGVGGPPRAALS